MNEELGILIGAKLDLEKSIKQLNADLAKIKVDSLNVNIDTSKMVRDVEKQVQQVNNKNKDGIKINADVDIKKLAGEFKNIDQFVKNLKESTGATSATVKTEFSAMDNQVKSYLVSLQKVGEETRKIRVTRQDTASGFDVQDITIIDDRELQNLKLAEEMGKKREQSLQNQRKEQERLAQAQAKASNKAIEDTYKEQQAEKKKTQELAEQLKLEQRQAQIRVQDLRRRYDPILTPEQNKQLDDYVASMNRLQATTPNLRNQMRHLNLDFKEVSAGIAEAGSRTDSFVQQIGVAMQRIK